MDNCLRETVNCLSSKARKILKYKNEELKDDDYYYDEGNFLRKLYFDKYIILKKSDDNKRITLTNKNNERFSVNIAEYEKTLVPATSIENDWEENEELNLLDIFDIT